jgi:hypothetical protein
LCTEKNCEKCTQFFPLSRPHRKGVHEKWKIGKFRKTSKNIFGTLDFFHEHNALLFLNSVIVFPHFLHKIINFSQLKLKFNIEKKIINKKSTELFHFLSRQIISQNPE